MTGDAGRSDPPATGVDFDLGGDSAERYIIDGDLADWTAPRAVLTNSSSGYDSGFGPDNVFGRLLVDWDDLNLYLAYTYRAAGNSALVHLDLEPGGSSTAERFSAWPRLVTFREPVDLFLAQYAGQRCSCTMSSRIRKPTRSTRVMPERHGVRHPLTARRSRFPGHCWGTTLARRPP
jgi:hypothetical protein